LPSELGGAAGQRERQRQRETERERERERELKGPCFWHMDKPPRDHYVEDDPKNLIHLS
jgi:hypothetical protein